MPFVVLEQVIKVIGLSTGFDLQELVTFLKMLAPDKPKIFAARMCFHVAGRGFIASRCECKLPRICGDLLLDDLGGSFDICYPVFVVVVGESFKKFYALVRQ